MWRRVKKQTAPACSRGPASQPGMTSDDPSSPLHGGWRLVGPPISSIPPPHAYTHAHRRHQGFSYPPGATSTRRTRAPEARNEGTRGSRGRGAWMLRPLLPGSHPPPAKRIERGSGWRSRIERPGGGVKMGEGAASCYVQILRASPPRLLFCGWACTLTWDSGRSPRRLSG